MAAQQFADAGAELAAQDQVGIGKVQRLALGEDRGDVLLAGPGVDGGDPVAAQRRLLFEQAFAVLHERTEHALHFLARQLALFAVERLDDADVLAGFEQDLLDVGPGSWMKLRPLGHIPRTEIPVIQIVGPAECHRRGFWAAFIHGGAL